MKYSELKKLLRKNGCYVDREGRSHEIWRSTKTGKQFTVSRHDTEEVPRGTLKSIKESAGIE